MRTKVLLAAAMLLLLSAGAALAGGKHKKYTCDDCSSDCLKNPYGKGCPSVCRSPECQEASCDSCTPECKKNPSAAGCPEICKDIKCQSCGDCTPECKKNPADPSCPDICKDIKCYTCDDCTADCIINPSGPGCSSVCADLGCNVCDKFPKDCPGSCKEHPDDPAKCPAACKGVPDQCIAAKQITCDDCPPSCNDNPEQCPSECKELNCHPKPESQAGPLRFVGDIGYFKQTDPADYAFGRIGAEWSPFAAGSGFENVSFLAMLGVSAQVGGDDGDDALLLDVFAQYNWKAGDVDGWVGLGLGGWITSGDVDDDSGDTDIDVMANVGARVYGDPNAFNASLFLEIRSAVDEFDGLAEYGRFGGGLRLKF
ncbi:MAG: hypothetical protein ACTFAL_14085 [Candidatus Electronema sp. V4]|uniref:hypothetical protein n=1 Tax=Candidatus Electronema sp. V4 TaxID=3454756 RepID=UPI0040554120